MSEIRFLEVDEEPFPPTTPTDEEEVDVQQHIDDTEHQKRLNQFQNKGARVHRRSVSHIGALSLVTTTKGSLPIISGMVIIDGKVDREDAKQMVIDRLINRFYRFRSVVKNMSVFEELSIEQMDLDYHLKYVTLPSSRFAATGEESSDEDEDERLREVLVEIDNKELDLSKPLWDSYLIENYSKGTVYYLRFHHCLGDGVSGGLILTSLNDESNNQQSPALEEARRVYQKIGMLSYIFHWLIFLIWLIAGSVVVLVRYAIDGLIPEQKTIFTKREDPDVKKEVAWSTKYSLKQIKEIQKACKATLNDIVLATIGGALQRYRKAHDPNYHQPAVVRFGIPFNIRSIQESLNMKDLSNQFGVVMNKVELNQAQSSITRLKKMKKTMDTAKKYPEAYVTNFLLKLLHLFSPTNNIFKNIFTILSGRCTWNCSNVRGPDFELRVCGKRVTHLVGFVPAPLGIAVAFLAASYNENLALSIRADNNVVPKVTELIHCWEDEIDDLLQSATNMSRA